MERDQYPDAPRDLSFTGGWRYGFANWFVCDLTEDWSEECERGGVHSSAGVAGFRPYVDRTNKYFLQIASTAGPQLPKALYLTIKPLIDEIMKASSSAVHTLR